MNFRPMNTEELVKLNQELHADWPQTDMGQKAKERFTQWLKEHPIQERELDMDRICTEPSYQ